jgi:formylglycine-generating enzyme
VVGKGRKIMKKKALLLITFFTACLLAVGCKGNFLDVTNDLGLTRCDNAGFIAGDTKTYTADGVSFIMVFVPCGMTFPTGVDDDGRATVAKAYWIGETEVTYELWQKVYVWATSGSGATGAGQYTFANAGRQGGDLNSGPVGTNQHPVTTINWHDSMVWCNALTEWYNAQKGTSYECVYTYSGSIIRDSQDSNATACDGAVASSTAKGFRLLSSNEWELAARWRSDSTNTVSVYSEPWFTRGDSASGATADYNNTTATGLVAWYYGNSGSSTHEVKMKASNSLGLFDMSGNVWEWCFDLSGSVRVDRGGSWFHDVLDLRVGFWLSYDPNIEGYVLGFRFARSAQ